MSQDTTKLIDLVRRMREAQKAYFARRTHSDMLLAKDLEREVDRELDRLDAKQAEEDVQLKMFA